MNKRIYCPSCHAELTNRIVTAQDISFVYGRHFPARAEVRITVPVDGMRKTLTRIESDKKHCPQEAVKLSLFDYFKIPGEALLNIGYGVESCGIICPECHDIIDETAMRKWESQ